MAVVRSFGSLQSLSERGGPAWFGASSGSLNLYGATSQTYGAIYRAQANVRTVIDFLGRNIAQLGLHVFRRLSDTDRERVAGHQLAGWLFHPNPSTTRYRLIESTMIDLGIYFNAYWLKIRQDDDLGLIRLPPEQMRVEGGLLPSSFIWTSLDGQDTPFKPSEIVHFSGYHPDNPLMGLSPLETLRRVLAEEYAAGVHRESFWRNAGRVDGVVTRPKEMPVYSPIQAQSWREQWQATYAGGAGSGKTVLLQGGETFTPTSWSARDSEYIAARKLSREECAAAYHVPLPMVGILEHATFSNIKEQHKHLYQDCLGPWLVMIAEELERQLLIECADQKDVYVEFNIAEKLKGSFEEQAASLQTLVGAPVMTRNEGRARLNLRAMPDEEADQLVTPLNMGGAAQTDQVAVPTPAEDADPVVAVDVAPVIQAVQARINARLEKMPAAHRPAAFAADLSRWDRELVTDLTRLVGEAEAMRLAGISHADTLAILEADAVA